MIVIHDRARKPIGRYLEAGLVDEMELSLVPTLLGGGERLFDNVGTDFTGSSARALSPPAV